MGSVSPAESFISERTQPAEVLSNFWFGSWKSRCAYCTINNTSIGGSLRIEKLLHLSKFKLWSFKNIQMCNYCYQTVWIRAKLSVRVDKQWKEKCLSMRKGAQRCRSLLFDQLKTYHTTLTWNPENLWFKQSYFCRMIFKWSLGSHWPCEKIKRIWHCWTAWSWFSARLDLHHHKFDWSLWPSDDKIKFSSKRQRANPQHTTYFYAIFCYFVIVLLKWSYWRFCKKKLHKIFS